MLFGSKNPVNFPMKTSLLSGVRVLLRRLRVYVRCAGNVCWRGAVSPAPELVLARGSKI